MASLPSLYRKLLKQAKWLPDARTSLFFKEKIQNSFRSGSIDTKRQRKLLRDLTAANDGALLPLKRSMEFAWARRGKLARTRVERILSEARNEDVEPYISDVPRTRPPYYSPRLAGYLTSSQTHKSGKAPNAAHLFKPPTLPERADPDSPEASMLGPLSKRREANIRWRYLTKFRSRLSAPMQHSEISTLKDLAANAKVPENCTRHREKLKEEENTKTKKTKHRALRVRFMRRRYQELLDGGTHLVPVPDEAGGLRWFANRPDGHSSTVRKFQATNEDLAWTQKR